MQLTSGNGGQISVWGHYADVAAKDLGDPFIKQWNHIVYSYDGSTSAQGKIYLNGILLTNTLFSGNIPLATEDTALQIGDRGLGMAKSGTQIDDVRIYNRALSATEAQALYAFESNPAPTITQHPVSQTVRVGGTVTLGVQATGFGTLTYQWRKNGADLPQATGAMLELVGLTSVDAGSYDVVVSSGSASITSDAAVLTVLHAPTISSLEDVILAEDGTLGPLAFSIADLDTSVEQLSISATSSLPGLVQEAAIQLAGTGTSRTLTLSPVANASGVVTITLRVSDGILETTESFVLTVQAVPDAPTDLTLTPASLAENNAPNAVVGTLAAVDVDLEDSHSFALVAGTGASDNGSFTISGNSLRMTPSADHETKSSYVIRVRATDGAGLSVEQPLTVSVLNVNEPPSLNGAATLAMIEDGLATLAWSVADVDTEVAALSLAVTATTNPALLPLGRVSFGGSGSARTVMLDPVEGQTGTATLTLTVSDGELSSSATLAVTVHENDIVIAQQPQPQEVSELSEARFSVQLSSGGEFATYQWQRNNQPIPGATQAELLLPSALLSQAGNYHVVITNPQTSAVSTQAVLLVRVLPEIKQQPLSVLVNAGEATAFEVVALGRPELAYQWRRNGADVSGARSSSHEFPEVSLSQAGRYQVRIRNSANPTGLLSDEVELGVVEAMEPSRSSKLQKGKMLKLTVAAAGNGLTYRWHRNGDTDALTGRATGWAARELIVENLTNADEGDYQCEVSGPGGTAWGAVTTLAVFDQKPRIQRPLLLDDARVGKSYAFTLPLDLDNGGEATSYAATGLPPGLKIDAATGVISGKPTVAKAEGYFVRVTASNSVGKDEETAGLAVAPLLPGTAGAYAAILRPDGWQNEPAYEAEHYGRLDLVVASTAAYSGSLTLGATKLPVAGVLDIDAEADPTGQLTLQRKGKPDLELSFTLIPEEGRPRQLVGAVEVQFEDHERASFELLGWRNPWSKSNPASAYAGTYNLALGPVGWSLDGVSSEPMQETDGSGHPVPSAGGYATLTATSNGVLKFAGRMADGESFSGASFVASPPYAKAVFYAGLSAGRGCMAGALDFVAESAAGARDARVSGHLLSWNRAPGAPRSRVYPLGFSSVFLDAVGGHYVPPAKGELLLDSVSLPLVEGNVHLQFYGAGLPEATPEVPMSLREGNKWLLPPSGTQNPSKVKFSVQTKTGLFKGDFELVDSNPHTVKGVPQTLKRKVSYQGLILPEWRMESEGDMLMPLKRRASGFGVFVLPQMPASVQETLSNTPILGGGVRLHVPE